MSFELLAILLLVVGCGLIVAEIFIPSGGMITILCVIAILSAIWCAYKAWWVDSPGYFWTYVLVTVLLIPGVVVGSLRVISTTSLGDRILLSGPSPQEVTPYQREAARLEEFIGRHGTALNLLTPGGLILVDGERLHGFTEGIMVEAGSNVEVIAVRGTRVLVRPCAEREPEAPNPQVATTDAAEASPLDFDVPQG